MPRQRELRSSICQRARPERIWLVYSNAPDAPGENFGNLNSNNTAIWNNTYATLPPSSVTVPGNRYIFAFAPGSTPATLTVTSLDDSKTYGDTKNLSLFTVSGFQAGVANAYLPDPNVYSGTPAFFSAGAGATADAGSYPIILSQGTLGASGSYSFAFNSAGLLTVNPKALTITANNVTQAFSNVPFSGGNGVIYNGLVNGQNPSALSGTITYWREFARRRDGRDILDHPVGPVVFELLDHLCRWDADDHAAAHVGRA